MRWPGWSIRAASVENDWVFVLDTSSIIQIKRIIPAREQWELAKNMERMVEKGSIVFPRQVTREISGQKHTDLPEAWVHGVDSKIENSHREADPEYLEEVMDKARAVVEYDAEGDPADPYILALALQMRKEGKQVWVVTEDVEDRLPSKISIRTACRRLGLPMMQIEEFVEETGLKTF